MAYANENYRDNSNIDPWANISERIQGRTEEIAQQNDRNSQNKYGASKTNNITRSPYKNGAENQSKALQQAKDQAMLDSQARDAAVDRQARIDAQALQSSQQRDDQVAKSERNSRYLIQAIDQGKVDVENRFKAEQSALDRNKSSDEFTQNRYQLKHNQAQDRANLEYITSQGLAKDKQSQDAELSRLLAANNAAQQLASLNNNANLNLANISQKTELAGQSSAVERAKLAASAQVRAALFAPRQYSGY